MRSDRTEFFENGIGFCPDSELLIDSTGYFLENWEIAIVEAEAPQELPDPLDGVKLRAVRWQEVNGETRFLDLAPVCMDCSMMISGVVSDDNDSAARTPANPAQVTHKIPACIGIESPAWLGCDELSVPDSNGAKVTDAFARWSMTADRISDFWGYPHAASASMLLEVNFVHSPEVNSAISCEFFEFFCVPPVQQDRLKLLGALVCVIENPFVGKVADIAEHVTESSALSSEKPIEAVRPTTGRITRNRRGFCARRPRPSSSRYLSTVTDALTFPRRRARQSLPSRTVVPNSPQTSAHRPKPWLLGDSSCLVQPEVLHVADDRIAPPNSAESRPEARISSLPDRQFLFVSCQQIITDHPIMRNYL